MAENTDEVNIDTPANIEAENPAAQITVTNDNESIIPNQETENMEVHHHPDLHHKPKKWKEYFLEFLMIFLAVTLGFFAENIREHISEHKNAKILSQSLIEDIEQDTAFLTKAIIFSNAKITGCDSLLSMLLLPRNEWNDTSFYRYLSFVSPSNPFFPTDGTYKQITTSGSLKYFDQTIINQLNAYDVQLKKAMYWAEVEDKSLWLLGDIAFTGVNVQAMADIRFNLPMTHKMFIKIPYELTDRFANLVAAVKTYRMKTLIQYKQQLTLADKLIESLKKEYHLQ